MIKVLLRLISIQFKTFIRQPEIIFWSLIFPILLFIILGFAFNSKKEILSNIGIINTPHISALKKIESLAKNKQLLGNKLNFNIHYFQTKEQAISSLKKGKITLFIAPQKNNYHYYFDPLNKKAKNDYLTIEKLLSEKQKNKTIILNAPGTQYIDFFLPGLLAMNIMSGCMWGIGWGLIEIRMKKYLKRLTATPMSRSIFLLAKLITRLIISCINTTIIIGLAMLIFGIKIQGSILAFIYLIIVGNFCFASIAILTASKTNNAMTGNALLNIVIMPMMLTSGIFFSYHNFPKFIIPLIELFPLTILANLFRAVFNEGAIFSTVFLPSIPLIIIGCITFVVGIKIFKWY